MRDGVRDGGGTGVDVELGEDVGHVAMDGALAEVQLPGDRAVRPAPGDEGQDLDLPSSESVSRASTVGRSNDPVQLSQIRTRAEPLERLPGRGELEPRTILVSERAAGPPDQDVQSCPLVRGVL